MSRADVRFGITEWLSGSVPALGVVYPSPPRFDPAQAYQPTPGSKSGAVAVVNITNEAENREAFGGWVRVTYSITLMVYFRSIEPEPRPGETDKAMAAFDELMEQLKYRLRGADTQDHTWGGRFWLIAEQSEAGYDSRPSIVVEYGEPVVAGGVTHLWAQVDFPAYEQLQLG